MSKPSKRAARQVLRSHIGRAFLTLMTPAAPALQGNSPWALEAAVYVAVGVALLWIAKGLSEWLVMTRL